MTRDKELQQFLGELVQEMIDMKKISEKARKDSWKYWVSDGSLAAYDWVFHRLLSILKPAKDGERYRVNTKGEIERYDENKENVAKSRKTCQ